MIMQGPALHVLYIAFSLTLNRHNIIQHNHGVRFDLSTPLGCCILVSSHEKHVKLLNIVAFHPQA